jgi:predicted metal-dependent hydrolase
MDYKIKRSARSFNLRISINSQAQVIVSAPKIMPEFLIRKYVEGQRAWIESNLAKVKKNQVSIQNDELYIFDKKYQVILNNQADKIGVVASGEKILVNNLAPKSSGKVQKQIEEFLKKTAHKYLATRTALLAKKMGVTYKNLALRQQASRWGSCSSRGNLNFNWRLVHYKPEIIDYVIIHELAHLIELNHSKKFWEIVKKYDSQYLLHKGELRKRRYN